MANNAPQWRWDPRYNDYYMIILKDGQQQYVWYSEYQKQRPRADSKAASASPPQHIEDDFELEKDDVPQPITGTEGDYEPLDNSYFVRKDAKKFFKKGRMFAVLFTEALGGTAPREDTTNVSYVKYGERVYSQIRRFVVVGEKKGICLACPIFTYGGRATTKPGINPIEHAIIHYVNASAYRLEGENGMTKNPIRVQPASTELQLSYLSRIRFGVAYPIQWNVKVKDLGQVVLEDMSDLIAYYQMERDKP